jgi:hypothetical protein
MSDYDYRNPEDPFRRDAAYDPNVRSGNSAWGWVAAAVFVAIVLAVVFGMGHQPGQNGTNTATNEARPPATANGAARVDNAGADNYTGADQSSVARYAGAR